MWVNAAAVIVYGEFEHVPSAVYRQVLETNLLGQIYGARAVLPHFRERGTGVLINLASVWGSVTSPYVSAYVVSKFGVRAFSESLQQALRLQRATRHIHVCTILPQSVDTPIFRHAANYTGRQAKPVPPVIDPQRVVRAILPSNGDLQWVWFPAYSKSTARLNLDGPGSYWYGSAIGNNEGRGLTGVIVVLGDVPEEARLDRPPQPRP